MSNVRKRQPIKIKDIRRKWLQKGRNNMKQLKVMKISTTYEYFTFYKLSNMTKTKYNAPILDFPFYEPNIYRYLNYT